MQAIFLDTETTGTDPSMHRILEIAFKLIDLPSGTEKLTYQAIVKQSMDVWKKRDPVSVEINGFTWEKTQQGKDEAVVSQEIMKIFDDYHVERNKAVYICQNPAFDRSFFGQLVSFHLQEQKKWPYHWLDLASMYWALEIEACRRDKRAFPKELPISKNAIAKRYQLSSESEPHEALNGVDHLILCYRAVVGFD